MKTLILWILLPMLAVLAKNDGRIGGYADRDIDLYYGNSKPSMVARYFPPGTVTGVQTKLKKLVVRTRSGVDRAHFAVHVYQVLPDGSPGAEVSPSAIVGIARKGTHDTSVDLRDDTIDLPTGGFFIGLEWQIIPANKYVTRAKIRKSKKVVEYVNYAPSFGTTRNEKNPSWGLSDGGEWHKFKKISQERIDKFYDDFRRVTGEEPKPFDNRFSEFAMELTVGE